MKIWRERRRSGRQWGGRPAVGQEFAEAIDGMALGDPCQDIAEPGVDVDADHAAGGNKAQQDRSGVSARVTAEEGPVAAADGNAAERSLSGIVVERQIAIFSEAIERLPMIGNIPHGPRRRALR